MSAEIIAKLGLDEARFERGLTQADRGFEAFAQKLRSKPIELIPAKSARESASVFQEIERQREQHVGTLDRDRIERALGQGAGAIGSRARKSAAESASAFGDLLPPLPEVDKKATGIIGLLKKKFGTTDLFKDAFKSIGLGLGVGAIASAVADHFSAAADKAKELAAHTGELYQGTLRLLGVVGGPTRQLELQSRQYKELNRDIEDQRKLIADLNSNPINFLTDSGRAAIHEAETGLNGLIKQQAEIAIAIDTAIIEENRRTEAIQRTYQLEVNLAAAERDHADEQTKLAIRHRGILAEIAAQKKLGALPSTLQNLFREKQAIEGQAEIAARAHREKMDDLQSAARLDRELTAAELRDASDVEKKQLRLNALIREGIVIKQRNGPTSTEAQANRNEQEALKNQILLAQKNARQTLFEAQVALGSGLAGHDPSRVSKPRPRGRSERERLADRGAAFRAQAEEAIRTGRSPDYVARLARSAAQDLSAVGRKVGDSTAKVDDSDAKALNSELISANKTLKEISANLKPRPMK